MSSFNLASEWEQTIKKSAGCCQKLSHPGKHHSKYRIKLCAGHYPDTQKPFTTSSGNKNVKTHVCFCLVVSASNWTTPALWNQHCMTLTVSAAHESGSWASVRETVSSLVHWFANSVQKNSRPSISGKNSQLPHWPVSTKNICQVIGIPWEKINVVKNPIRKVFARRITPAWNRTFIQTQGVFARAFLAAWVVLLCRITCGDCLNDWHRGMGWDVICELLQVTGDVFFLEVAYRRRHTCKNYLGDTIWCSALAGTPTQ